MKHTPGPWEIHGKNIYGHILIGKKGEKNSSGKIVKVTWDCCGQNSEEWKANAILISKAPEMLEALKEFMKFCDFFYEEEGHKLEPYEPFVKAFKLIKEVEQ